MSKEKVVLISCWILNFFLVLKFIPKTKLRNAVVIFLYKQVITWLFGLIVVEKGLIKYPVRAFRKSYKGSFSFEYFVYPSLCALFNLYYPEKSSKFIKFLYLNAYTACKTLIEAMLERHTNLIQYVNWKWYWSYLTMGIVNYVSRLFYRWFYKEEFSRTKFTSN